MSGIISEIAFAALVKTATSLSYYIQTGDTGANSGCGDREYYGILTRKISFNEGLGASYNYDYTYTANNPKNTLVVTKDTDEPWDFDFIAGYDVVGSDGETLSGWQLIDVITSVRPDLLEPVLSAFDELTHYPLAYDPAFKHYSLTVANYAGPIGVAEDRIKEGAITMPSVIKGVEIDSKYKLLAWAALAGGGASVLNEIEDAIRAEFGKIVCSEYSGEWHCFEFEDGLNYLMPTSERELTPDALLSDTDYGEQYYLTNQLLGFVATMLGLRRFYTKTDNKKGLDRVNDLLARNEELVLAECLQDELVYKYNPVLMPTNNHFTVTVFDSFFKGVVNPVKLLEYSLN